MTKRNTRRALLMCALSVVLCVSMLIGSTFAWFTDSVTTSGNKIQAGTLKLDLELLDKESGEWNSIKEEQTALFNYDKWEPGYTETKVLKVENEGNLALKWYAKIVLEDGETVSELANAIDVYVNAYGVLEDDATVVYPADRNLDGYVKVGTLASFIDTMESTTYGSLKANESAYLGLALKMQEEAGNEYQGLDLAGAFDIMVLATQDTVESDSFGNQYDANAEFPTLELPAVTVEVTSADGLLNALGNLDPERDTIIDATGLTVDINTIGVAPSSGSGMSVYDIPGSVTIKNLAVVGSYRGGNYIMFQGNPDDEIVFEDCTFEPSGRTMGLGFAGYEGCANSVVYNNCTFKGFITTNFVNNPDGVATFNNCTFTKAATGQNYVLAMGGTHIFNNCTFDYTGVSQTHIGTGIYTGSINSKNDSDNDYSTAVILNGCTLTNCGARKDGANSTLTIN